MLHNLMTKKCVLAVTALLSLYSLNLNAQSQQPRPYIEVEKADEEAGSILKAKKLDRINFFSQMKMNNLNAKKLVTFETLNLTPTMDAEVGVEYMKPLGDSMRLSGAVAATRYVMPSVGTSTPQIEKSERSQISGSIGTQILFTDDNYIGFGAHLRPYYYLNTNSSSRAELDHTLSSAFSVDTEYQFYKERGFVVAAQFGTEYINNAKISGNTFGFNFGVLYQQEFRNDDAVKVKLSFNQSALDTETYSLTNNSMALSFLYGLPN